MVLTVVLMMMVLLLLICLLVASISLSTATPSAAAAAAAVESDLSTSSSVIGNNVNSYNHAMRKHNSHQGRPPPPRHDNNNNNKQQQQVPPQNHSSPRSSSSSSSQQQQSPHYQMIFSTGCSDFQAWQARVFFYHAHKVRQTGTITRIVSGCEPEDIPHIQQDFEETIQGPYGSSSSTTHASDFQIHFTPNWSFDHVEDTKYFNKPFGILDWMENVLGYSNNNETAISNNHDDSIIMILDPDMMLLRPLTHDFTSEDVFPHEYWSANGGNPEFPQFLKEQHPLEFVVRHGFPISQGYGFEAEWWRQLLSHRDKDFDDDDDVYGKLRTVLEGFEDESPFFLKTTDPDSGKRQINSTYMTLEKAEYWFPSGPPYLATARDMYQIVRHWVQFVPRMANVTKGEFMVEMYGYSLAAAHLRLPHQLTEKFMVSDVDSDREGWDFLLRNNNNNNTISKADACHPPSHQLRAEQRRLPVSVRRKLPFVLHYCQRYALGRWFVGKYKLPVDFFTNCASPLMRTPPENVGELYDWYIYPNGIETAEYFQREGEDPDHENEATNDIMIKRNVWAMCTIMDGWNEVARQYKVTQCKPQQGDADADHHHVIRNLDETYIFHEKDAFENFLKHGTLGQMV